MSFGERPAGGLTTHSYWEAVKDRDPGINNTANGRSSHNTGLKTTNVTIAIVIFYHSWEDPRPKIIGFSKII